MLLTIDLLYGVSTPMAWESMDKHLSGKLILISDCKTLHTKFDNMDVNTWFLADGDAAHFHSWMTLASFESYITMKESKIRSDRKIAILSDACWGLFNDFFDSSSNGMITVTQTFKLCCLLSLENLTNVWRCLLMMMITNILASSHFQL